MNILPVLASDSYKQFHHLMYPENMLKLYSNMTPRKSRLKTQEAVWFGLNYYIKEYLIKQWNELFFDVSFDKIEAEYKRFHKYFSGVDVTVDHLKELHDLGYMPLCIKALPEGELVPMKVPFYTITNTDGNCAWLVNFLETQMSTVIWDLTTVATLSYEYLKLLNAHALKTTGSTAGVQWQAHDFAMRGRTSMETSMNQAGHLLSFTGTDTIPAVLMLEKYYGANMEKELIGGSVPATEHSVMTSYGRESEIDAFKRLLEIFPNGILSVVADSYDLFAGIQKTHDEIFDLIMNRKGTLVYRPDSGDPVDILCGYERKPNTSIIKDDSGIRVADINDNLAGEYRYISSAEYKGVVELLWDLFGGTVNELGYKLLNNHVGCIYGDSITLDRAEQICNRLAAKGFASTSWVAGVGSYTFNYNTRDTLGIAVKSTYCEIGHPLTEEEIEEVFDNIGKKGYSVDEFDTTNMFRIEAREIFKDPITDDGTKKSAKGLLRVDRDPVTGLFKLTDQVTEDEEAGGELKVVYENGKLLVDPTLAEIRKIVQTNSLKGTETK